MIGRLCNDKIELGDWPLEHQDWSRFVSFPYGCGLWLWLAQLCVSHPCPLMTKATGPFQLNTAVQLSRRVWRKNGDLFYSYMLKEN